MLLRQLSYAIKNQLGHPKSPTRGFACPTESWRSNSSDHSSTSRWTTLGYLQSVYVAARVTSDHQGNEDFDVVLQAGEGRK